jgi:hypothetical protein
VKAFVEYLDYDLAGNLNAPCGDRAYFILDGRNNLTQWIEDAIANNGHRRPKYPHFNIHRGDFKSSTIVYKSQIN